MAMQQKSFEREINRESTIGNSYRLWLAMKLSAMHEQPQNPVVMPCPADTQEIKINLRHEHIGDTT